ncbi:MAG: hypothetical protein KC731_17570 [Myxococcales bacterium]|nr:hypothetical protein [Myxococcales bacterium]
MRFSRLSLLLAPLTVAIVYGCGGDEPGGTGGNVTALSDADGDGISDIDEGVVDEIDTDGDGTPDYLDTDSDNDTILDEIEGGDGDLNTAPIDSDQDGTPDFRDLDSDDNLILDQIELAADLDGDGTGDYADIDNDGDGAGDIVEIEGPDMDCDGNLTADPIGTPDAPADCDGDGVPNFMDFDSDDDTISDKDEGTVDTDSDGFVDRYELDSDNDNFLDSVEAGDADINTAPVDSDSDLTPDFRDPDSDNDGLSDANEFAAGTDPTNPDSDGDGVSDLIEFAAGTNPNDATDNPQAKGDFVFVVPYQEPTTPPDDTLEFRTSVQFADVYFLFDETGSMSQEFTAMSTSVPTIISDLKCNDTGAACLIDSDCAMNEICFSGTGTCVEDPLTANMGAGCVPDLWTGVGRFNNCNTYQHNVALQSDPTVTANAIGNTGPGSAESVVQSPACVADPTICTNNPSCSADPSVANPVGCPGFRPEAVRILISITDADNQGGTCGGTVPDVQTAGTALANQGIKFIGLYGTGDDGSGTLCTTPADCAQQLGVASGTVDTMNQPFAYPALDSQVVDATKQAVLEVVRGVPLNVTIDAADEPNDAGDALQFLDYLEVNVSGQGNCTMVSPTADTNADTHDDAFPALLGGTPVCWNVIPVASQSTTPPADEPQLFLAKLTVYGDGSPLDSRNVYFLVPPKDADIPPVPR